MSVRCEREHTTLKVEHLAQWYLRLNGFLTMNDFVLHRDHRPYGQMTDEIFLESDSRSGKN